MQSTKAKKKKRNHIFHHVKCFILEQFASCCWFSKRFCAAQEAIHIISTQRPASATMSQFLNFTAQRDAQEIRAFATSQLRSGTKNPLCKCNQLQLHALWNKSPAERSTFQLNGSSQTETNPDVSLLTLRRAENDTSRRWESIFRSHSFLCAGGIAAWQELYSDGGAANNVKETFCPFGVCAAQMEKNKSEMRYYFN